MGESGAEVFSMWSKVKSLKIMPHGLEKVKLEIAFEIGGLCLL